ncbi:S41 family peptidase [Parerythrobacter jejuensis]|uniref:Peptidase S41 n=1 Tax=Parerythrobacter jejuensis TaxID=795812 RepID=A0A845ATC9_9SPHN|nr:hypothetical protein [Parerythrobacter jejuensis]MXP32854.1 hypothetical protein [Parerythrobacter jejuensis]
MKRFLKWAFGIWGVVTIALAIWYGPLISQVYHFNPWVSEADFGEPANALEAQQQDLQYLATVLDYDRSFAPQAREEFGTRIDKLIAANTELSKAEFYLETQALMALADNAHTSSDPVTAFRQFNRSGLDVYRFADGYFVVRAQQALADHVGKQLVSIEGRPVEDVLAALEIYSGGPKARRDLISLYFLRSPALLHAAGLAASPDVLTVTLANSEGAAQTVELTALSDAAETEFSYRHPFTTLSPWPLSDEAGEWVRTLDGDAEGVSLPLTHAGSDTATSSTRLGEGVYVRSNYLADAEWNPVAKELPATLDGAPEGGFAFIVLDLRWNPGGDLSNAIPFAKKAGEALAQDGKAYVIVSPQTFSAAIVAAALMKQHVPGRTLIIGEPMGDRPQFWAERGTSFVLPNAGYNISYATGYHDWEKGCDYSTPYCFPPSERDAADIGTLALDEQVMPTYAQYAAGDDPVLDWVLAREQ